MKKIILILVLSFIPSPSYANNGQNASGDPKVVALIHWYADNRQGCSGALVAPRVVFTAAHCLSRMPKDGKWKPDYNTELPVSGKLSDNTPMWVVYPGQDVYIDNNSKPNQNRVKVIAQFAPSDYVDSGSLNNDPKLTHGSINDFGVLILEKPIGDVSFKIADKSTLNVIVSNRKQLLAIGYGMSAPNTLPTSPNKMNVVAKNQIIIQNNSYCVLSSGYCNGSNTVIQANNNPGEYWGGGDSGSPLWYFDGKEWLYVGAMSGPAGCLANHFPNGPSCTDKYWLENGYGEYWTASTYSKVISDAFEFLRNQELLDSKVVIKKTNTIKVCQHDKRKFLMQIKGKKCPSGYSLVSDK